ncbi:hypothetical protein [Enterobacter asburiae]|uniref:hypothetical protein n=1 Tax=Enterobacter asburiae TaxID=61645 RepID=UPI003F437D4F
MENILSKKQKKELKKTYLNTERKIRNSIGSNRKGFYCGIAVLAVLTAYSLFKPKEQQTVIPQVNQDYENCMSWNRSNSINRKQYLSPVQINGVVVDSAVNDFCAADKNRNRVSSEQNGLWLMNFENCMQQLQPDRMFIETMNLTVFDKKYTGVKKETVNQCVRYAATNNKYDIYDNYLYAVYMAGTFIKSDSVDDVIFSIETNFYKQI